MAKKKKSRLDEELEKAEEWLRAAEHDMESVAETLQAMAILCADSVRKHKAMIERKNQVLQKLARGATRNG